ncbi:MAG: hypothetical protein ACP5OG_02405 [Candidatus Nanoarchaeia archaeon]
MSLVIGNPIKPMLVKDLPNSENKYKKILKLHDSKTYSEVKSDGYRIQIHKNNEIKLFTRNLNELNLYAFPDLISSFNKLPEGIYDGELVGIEDGINGFNAVKKRVRSELVPQLVDNYPLQVKYFDLLNLNGHDLIHNPLYSRRKKLENITSNLSELVVIDDPLKLKQRYEEVTSNGLEGLVCKDPNSCYLIDTRNNDWLKLKKFLNLDLVVLGVYSGEGKLSKLPFAALLLGTYNEAINSYETITKVGISDKEKIILIYDKIKNNLLDNSTLNVVISGEINKKGYSKKLPNHYIDPNNSVVVETDALNITRSKNWHSCGLYKGLAYSLRIPVVKRIRLDKKTIDCAKTEDISDLYTG